MVKAWLFAALSSVLGTPSFASQRFSLPFSKLSQILLQMCPNAPLYVVASHSLEVWPDQVSPLGTQFHSHERLQLIKKLPMSIINLETSLLTTSFPIKTGKIAQGFPKTTLPFFESSPFK